MPAERTTTVNWAFRREIGNALGYPAHPVYEWGFVDADGKVREYPAWDTDLNATFALAAATGAPFILTFAGKTPVSAERVPAASLGDSGLQTADTPALAICRAFLKHTDGRR